ncbi:MAG: amino acid ABC transporter ATP-binding protein [Oscillospiraceae bacterium]|nr:amino acid ABC transporter ATP-binding protein [Oscillospiraceae bacterium]
MIRIEHLKKAYPDATPLKDVNAHIDRGDVISVIGPSGTGKSTLLRCINLLETPTDGHIFIDGEEITDPKCDLGRIRRKMGMVFQHFNLFGHMTVIENVMYAPIKLLGKTRQQAYDEGIRLLAEVGMAGRALRYPEELSGGQKQRVAIARTLAMDPEVILLDEPTSALDPTMVGEVQQVIKQLAAGGKTMMIVTHEMSFARAVCSRVFYMDEGGIYEDGTPEQIFENPRRENTRRFIRQLKVLELRFEGQDIDLYGAASAIREYCARHELPYEKAYSLILALEELIQQILLPALKDPTILAVVEYDRASGEITADVRSNGVTPDPASSGNALAWKLLRGTVSELTFEPVRKGGYTNCVHIVIR